MITKPHLNTLAALTALTLAVSTHSVQAGTFSDNFSDPAYSAANWTDFSFSTINNGSLTATNDWTASGGPGGTYSSPTGNGGFNFSLASTAVHSDFTLRLDFLSPSDCGVILRSDPSGANALVLIFRPSLNDAYFITRHNGRFENLHSYVTGINSALSADFQLTVTGMGNDFSASAALLSAPSTPVFTIFTSGLSDTAGLISGQEGVYKFVNDPTASFDNFTLTASQISSPSVPEPVAGLIGFALLGAAGFTRRPHR